MKRKVVIVGTSHNYQVRGGGDDFYQFLRAIVLKHAAPGIAEEFSVAALTERHATRTIAKDIAQELAIEHLYCDPEPEERVRLGICSENDIRATGFLNNLRSIDVRSQIRASLMRRECYWLHMLSRLDKWPVIFICGANHVHSFSAMLRKQGFAVSVAAKDWAPAGPT